MYFLQYFFYNHKKYIRPGRYIKADIDPALLAKIIMTSISHDALQELENGALVSNFQFQQDYTIKPDSRSP